MINNKKIKNKKDKPALCRSAIEDLHRSEAVFVSLIENLPDPTFAVNKQGGVIVWNKGMEKLTGRKSQEVVGKDNYIYSLPFYGRRRPALVDLIVGKDRRIEKRYPYIKREGSRIVSETFVPCLNKGRGAHLWLSVSPLFDEQGKITGAIESIRDITQNREEQAELFSSREMLRFIFDNIPQRIFWKDRNSVYLGANKSLALDAGYRNPAEIVGKTDFQTAWKSLARRFRADDQRVMKEGKPKLNYEEPLVKVGEKPAWLRTSKVPLRNKEGKIFGVLCTYEDITAHKLAEDALRRSEEKLREIAVKDEALLASIADGVIAVDNQGKIILINDAALAKLGWTKNSAMGKKWSAILTKEDKDRKVIPPKASDFYQAIKYGKIISNITPYFYVGKNGQRFPVARAVSPVIIDGKIIGAITVFRDISKEQELDQAKNDFLSLASHQLRTPLSAIKWILEILLEDTGVSGKQKQYLEDVYNSNERLITLVNELLDATRIEAGNLTANKKMANLAALIKNSCQALKLNAEKKGQTIDLSIQAPVKNIHIDPVLFSQSLNNILSNAIGFGSEKSKISVRLTEDKDDYLVSVHNFGPHIRKTDQARIFTKFFRGANSLNSKYIGSGLGLFLVKSAVEANGGKIWFKSRAQQGTTFYFSVPKRKNR